MLEDMHAKAERGREGRPCSYPTPALWPRQQLLAVSQRDWIKYEAEEKEEKKRSLIFTSHLPLEAV